MNHAEMAKGKGVADHDAAEPDRDSLEDFFSDTDSSSASIEIADLKKRMWNDRLLFMKLEARDNNNRGGSGGVQQKQPCPDRHRLATKQEEEDEAPPESRYRRKAMLRAQDGVLRHMLKMMDACNARGFVYGVVDADGVPVSGSSDSLRSWWKDDVGFGRAAPTALLCGGAAGSPTAAPATSFLHDLHDIQDSTLGSLLSALIQHCEPPQRSFPLDGGLPPPWWPTGTEPWWGLQGEDPAHQGAPPYRKPHDLKKAWKISLLSAVIKHLGPRFDRMRRLVWQSKRLQQKMSARDANTWSRVIAQEEALDRRVLPPRALQITSIEVDEQDQHVDKRKRRAGGDEEGGAGGSGSETMQLMPALLPPDIGGVPEVGRSSIDELITLYYRCLQGTDGEQEKDAAVVTGDAGQTQSGGGVGETDQDAKQHDDDGFDVLLSAGDMDVSDFPIKQPIWQWGVYQ